MKKQKTTKGAGRLFKRYKGKDYPADAPIKGRFYLTITANGSRQKIALRNDAGEPITTRREAEAMRDRLTAPAKASDDERRAKAIAGIFQDAEERRKQAEADAERKELLTIARSWDAYLKAKKNAGEVLADRTESSYCTYWKQFTGWLSDHHPDIQAVEQITEQHAKSFAAYLADRKETNKTRNCKIGFQKSFFSMLKDADHITGNPFICIKPLKFRAQTRGKRALTIEELQRLIETAQDEYKTLFIIGTFTGLRLIDAATLKWSAIDFDRGVILTTPKKTENTSGAEVLIGIPTYMHNHLLTLSHDGAYVMPDIAYRYLNGRSRSVSKQIQRIFTDAGIERTKHSKGRTVTTYEEGFHALRHSFVSLAAERGAAMGTIQQIVGHTSEAMTEHYHHVSAKAAQDAAKLIDWTPPTPSQREPLPLWAATLVEGMTAETWAEVKTKLLDNGNTKVTI